MQYCEIDLNHFLKLKFPSRICQKKALILDPDFYWEHRGQFNHTFKLKNVEEVVQYYQNYNNLNIKKQKSKENNWEYFNC